MDDLKQFVAMSLKPLQTRMLRMPSRGNRTTGVLAKLQDLVKTRESEEVGTLSLTCRSMFLHHKTVKKLDPDSLFKAVDKKKDGKIDEGEFLAFLKKCEKPMIKKKKPEAEKKEDDKAEKKDDDDKEDKKNENGDEKKEDAEETEPMALPSKEDLQRVFNALDEDDECAIKKDQFMKYIRVYMKVVKETVCTKGIEIKSEIIRRLEMKEVVEVLEGPVPEGSVEIDRIKVRVMRDDSEAWVTLAGNQGTVFLIEGGSQWAVVKETVLTDNFDPTEKGTTSRKLKAGELVDVLEWPKKEETSGLTRMKCKTVKGGFTGWATTLGNTGTVFLEAA